MPKPASLAIPLPAEWSRKVDLRPTRARMRLIPRLMDFASPHARKPPVSAGSGYEEQSRKVSLGLRSKSEKPKRLGVSRAPGER